METTLVEHANPNDENHAQPGKTRARFSLNNLRLRTRLTLLILVIAVPLIVMTSVAVNQVAETRLTQFTNEQLRQTNAALLAKAELWIQYNVNVVKQLASLDEIVGMDPLQQTPILEKTGQAFPEMFLLHTINPVGFDLARNDGQEYRDYSDREWFIRPMAGDEVTTQVLISRTTNKPSLAIAVPIRAADGNIVGVMQVAIDLGVISKGLVEQEDNPEQLGFVTFVVDSTDKLVAHPDAEILVTQKDDQITLTDFSTEPAVVALRAGTKGRFVYTDEKGLQWVAYLSEMPNGWGFITQQPVDQSLSSLTALRRMTWWVAGLAALLMSILVYLAIRRSMAPIGVLTTSAAAIAGGDLFQNVPVQRMDEIGELAASFNIMTEQLRGLVGSLEERVEDRTRAIELSAEVSRRLATILNPEDLAREVVEQLQSAFNYYHVHIYTFDERNEDLLMAGGTGEAGRLMLARGHKIARGKGLVGRAAISNTPVIVEDTSQDPDWLPNPLLPETKTEVAVPIAVGGRVLGVLDVQQNRVNGLKSTDIALIQSIANQVAVALQNARAYVQVQEQADRESLITALNQKIQRTTSVDEALQVAVSELGLALSAKSARIELRSNESPTFKN